MGIYGFVTTPIIKESVQCPNFKPIYLEAYFLTESGLLYSQILFIIFSEYTSLTLNPYIYTGGDGGGGDDGRISHLPPPIPRAQEKIYP